MTQPVPGGNIAQYRGVALRLLAIAAVIVGAIFGVRYLMGSGPAEKYRVSHPAGYSILRPSDWKANLITTTDADGFVDSILLAPDNWKGQEPSMWIKRYGAPPDFEKLQSIGFSKQTFQGQPVWMSQQQPKRHLIRTAIFQRGESWFNAGVALPGLEGAKVDDWWQFLESVKVGRNPNNPNNPATSAAR